MTSLKRSRQRMAPGDKEPHLGANEIRSPPKNQRSPRRKLLKLQIIERRGQPVAEKVSARRSLPGEFRTFAYISQFQNLNMRWDPPQKQCRTSLSQPKQTRILLRLKNPPRFDRRRASQDVHLHDEAELDATNILKIEMLMVMAPSRHVGVNLTKLAEILLESDIAALTVQILMGETPGGQASLGICIRNARQ